MKAQKAKMKGNEGPKGQKLQNAAGFGADKICLNFIRKRAVFGNLWGKTSRGSPDKPKMKEMKPQTAKMKRNEAQKAKMKGNEGPKGQNERKWRPKRPKWKEKAKMKGNEGPKGQKLQNAAGLGADKICLTFIRKRAVFVNLWGGPHVAPQTNQKVRKWTPERPKWKEMKAQKAKLKGNEGPKGQNERKWRPKKVKINLNGRAKPL